MRRRDVLIEIDGRRAYVQPPDDDVAELCAVTYEVVTYEQGGPLGYRPCRARRRLGEQYDLHGRLLLPARAVPAASRRLREAGFHVEVRRLQRPDAAWALSQAALVQADPSLRPLLQAIITASSGVIEVEREATDADVAALVCRAFPLARVFVAASTRRRVRQLHGELEARLGFWVGLAGTRRGGEDQPVVVGTLQAATDFVQQHSSAFGGDDSHGNADDNRPGRDVLLVADAGRATTESAAGLLLESRAPRVYALLHSGRRLDVLKRFWLELMFGPTLWREEGPEGMQARVRAVFVQPEIGADPRAKSPLERKRLRTWHNDRRNDVLAALANALVRP